MTASFSTAMKEKRLCFSPSPEHDEKIPKVHLEKLIIHVPGRNQPSMSRDFRGEDPG